MKDVEISVFEEYCNDTGIVFEKVFMYHKSKTRVNERFKCRSSILKRKKSTQYIVKYFVFEKVWVAWKCCVANHSNLFREDFSLSYKDYVVHYTEPYSKIEKSVEHSGWGMEMVYVFSADGIDMFFKDIKKEGLRLNEGMCDK